jgi:hypothetical protein
MKLFTANQNNKGFASDQISRQEPHGKMFSIMPYSKAEGK